MDNKIITDDILKKATEGVIQTIADNIFEFESYSDESIAELFDLTSEEAEKVSQLINDEVISKYKIWSSYGTNEVIKSAVSEANDYTDNRLSNLASISLKYCTVLPTMGESNCIYILKSTNSNPDTLNLYDVDNASWVSIGSFDVSLNDYYTKTEIDTALVLKADKIEILAQDDVIVDTSLATTSNVLSATTIIEELDKKVDKVSIATTIDENSTDDEVVGAKTFYDDVSNKNMKAYTTLEQVGLTADVSSMDEILTAIPFSTYFNISTGLFINRTTLFPGKFQSVGFLKIERTSTGRPLILYSEKETDVLYKGYLNGDGNFKAWGRLCTTSVDDVPQTTITFTDTTNYKNADNGNAFSYYYVQDGICYLSIYLRCVSPVNTNTRIECMSDIPKPKTSIRKIVTPWSLSNYDVAPIFFSLENTSQGAFIMGGNVDTNYLLQFSYPVAES